MFEKCIVCDRLGALCVPHLLSMDIHDLVRWCSKRLTHLHHSRAWLAEQSGIPLSTINRIWADDFKDIRYTTMHAIVVALIGHAPDELPCPSEKNDSAALAEVKERSAIIREDNRRAVDFLKQQLAARDEQLRQKDRSLRIVACVLGAVLLLIFAAVMVDFAVGSSIGWIR